MDARDRALQRLIEMLTPAAALGVDCPDCEAQFGELCTMPMPIDSRSANYDRDRHLWDTRDGRMHDRRVDAAREMLASDLRVLFEG
jgi:hypothetical protein